MSLSVPKRQMCLFGGSGLTTGAKSRSTVPGIPIGQAYKMLLWLAKVKSLTEPVCRTEMFRIWKDSGRSAA